MDSHLYGFPIGQVRMDNADVRSIQHLELTRVLSDEGEDLIVRYGTLVAQLLIKVA
jgi:hypothetical protein